jgi:hypothetical protein
MWDQSRSSRIQQLRQRQGENVLTDAEQAEQAQLAQELEAAEANYLGPATEELRQQRENLQTQNRTLEMLALRKEALVLRLRDFLAEAHAERRAIEFEHWPAVQVQSPMSSRCGKRSEKRTWWNRRMARSKL